MADGSVERPAEFGQGPAGVVQRWLAEIKAYDKTFERWKERSRKIIKRYRDERDSDRDNSVRFNVLWSNIQTLQPTIYAKLPVPYVDRRHRDRDPVGRAAADVLERSLSYSLDTYDFDGAVKSARDDYLLTGRGVAWVRYVPQFGEPVPEVRDPETGQVLQEEYRPVVAEDVLCDHILWDNFGHTPAPSWPKVSAVWKRELMTRSQLISRFGEEVGKAVSMTRSLTGVTDETAKSFGDVFQRAEVYEIWDKDSRKVYWVSDGYTKAPLDEQDDPLHLTDFFPCPKPIYGTLTTDSLIPVPDYLEYQAQAIELDNLTGRIAAITKALKVAGVYPGGYDQKLEALISGGDNRLVPIENWAVFQEGGGARTLISWLPVSQIAEVLMGLINMREQIKRDLNEVTGLSDIVRGQASGGARTATEQRIKGQYASLRLQDRQGEMSRFIRDLIRIKAEIIAEHFDPRSLAEMSGWMHSQEAETLDRAAQDAQKAAQAQMPAPPGMPGPEMMGQPGMPGPEMMGQPGMPGPEMTAQMPPPVPGAQETFDQAVRLLHDDRLRSFRIDIETDSTVFEDDQAEKQARNEFLTMASGLLTQGTTAIQQMPELAPLFSEMLLFGVRGFRSGRQLEAAFEQTIDAMRMKLEQPPEPTPEQKAAEAEMQMKQAEMQMKQAEMQAKQQEAQARLQIEAQRDQMRAAAEQAKLAFEQQKAQAEMALEQQIAEAKIALEREIATAKLQLEQQAAQVEIALRQQEAEASREMEREKVERKAGLDKELGYAKLVAGSMPQQIMQFDADGTDGLLAAFSDRLGQTDEAQLAALSEFFTQQAAVLAEQSNRQLALLEQGIKALMDAANAPRSVTIERDARGRVVGGSSTPARVQ